MTLQAFKMAALLWAATWAGALCLRAQTEAPDVCALTVELATTDGLPPGRTSVALIGPSGAVVQHEWADSGVARFCDFGFGLHRIRVGAPAPFPVEISNISLNIHQPLRLRVLINLAGSHVFATDSCPLLLRVTDPQGKPLRGVEVRSSAAMFRPARRTDGYGRFSNVVVASSDLVFSKEGFEDQTRRVECSERKHVEMTVVMPANR